MRFLSIFAPAVIEAGVKDVLRKPAARGEPTGNL
jgi:hypothetical protein